ncbi:MAG TPA: 1-deoxy-D-xylulose-5-phosphate reductoisomerase [Candidatus Gallacutalibacter pullicola]|uniref:1-deoxy-D-xylulose 5-phosphate reductoisomerase n=1 Tax=Candidatus Gallacutalibacter pullicola TaxID=2840830 RepID=A0A9D1DRR2_9FIRM|nr:1-deoxy-D-xylulose-5-phosphate reductoisomerase [Candidatus Gallacutalibacter pullicola]
MKKNLSILGSTGSIGTQTLDVARNLSLEVTALAAYGNIKLLEEQIREFHPALAVVFDEEKAKQLRTAVADTGTKILAGMDGLCEAASIDGADVVVNAVVGCVGLQPTLAAIGAGKDLALANKETLVAGGALVMRAAEENGVKIFPVDSEHSAIFQCLQGCPEKKFLSRIILTASGGPFFGKTKEELAEVTPRQALKHPNWDMGAKITIDSSTMMNKGLEILEASWLFDMPVSQIDVVIHRESVIHSLIEYVDHSVIAQLGVPDMRIPIQYAITWPERYPSPVKRLSLADYGTLTFAQPDEETFRCLAACKEAGRRGGLAPAAANGANEAAVDLFLKEKISFLEIGELVWAAMDRQPDVETITSVDDILTADRAAREFVYSAAGKMR